LSSEEDKGVEGSNDDQRTCQWCGNLLPHDARTCPTCGGNVPNPEGSFRFSSSRNVKADVPEDDPDRARIIVERVWEFEYSAQNGDPERKAAENVLVTGFLLVTGIVVVILAVILILPLLLSGVFSTFLGVDTANLRDMAALLVLLAVLVVAGLVITALRR
jgi:hypothetical protein